MNTVAPAFDEVVISERGGGLPRRVPIAAPQMSWEISNTGTFSAFARIDDLRRASLGQDLSGKWLTYDGGYLGRWGGVITGRPVTEGTAEIAAEGWGALARGRVIPEGVFMTQGPAAGIAARAIMEAGRDGATFLTIGTIEEGGNSVAIRLTGDVMSDILPQLVEAGDLEWIVDADRRFHAGRRLGRDRSHDVRLVEDVHITTAHLDNDLWTTAPTHNLRVRSALAGGAGSAPLWTTLSELRTLATASRLPEGVPVGGSGVSADAGAISPGAVQFYGVDPPIEWAATATGTAIPPWAGMPVGIGANTPAIPSVHGAPLPTTPMSLEVSNARKTWRLFDVGDTVHVDMGSVGFCGRLRIMVKAVDVSGQSLTVGGEALED